ncbi:hypothetical protein BDQ17DRAFT_1350153 [Cyathus striatus]|nr:hypothetical protein BDQ17DRAFT_1350153 [Cyathus striatus]
MSTTTTLTHLATTTSSSLYTTAMMLPTSDQVDPAELDCFSRIVRFDNECVLIPDTHRTKSPRMLTKSYSLPLWKRRNTPSSDTEATLGEEPPLPSSPGELTFIPHTRSPTRGRSSSMSPSTPLSPCLVQRTTSASPVLHYKRPAPPVQRPSLPIYHRHKDESALTIPLRACCPDCERITEECLKEGEQWQEKFTKGARRRRSASLDNATPYASTSANPAGFTAIAAVSGSGTAVIPTTRTNNPPLRLSRSHHTNFSFGSTTSASDTNTLSTSPVHSSLDKHIPRSSPIQEEDEAQLFPLPKRSPSNSPRTSPVPSPNGSSASLPVAGAFSSIIHTAASRSKDSLSSRGSGDEDMKLKSPISRKCSKGLLGITGNSPGSSKKERLLDSPQASPTLASPPDLTAAWGSLWLPRPRPLTSNCSSPRNAVHSTNGTQTRSSLHLHFPARHQNHANSPPMPITYASSSPVADAPSSPTSPTPKQQRKQSFTHQFMRASEAVLRGVSSIGGGGGGIVGSV